MDVQTTEIWILKERSTTPGPWLEKTLELEGMPVKSFDRHRIAYNNSGP